MRQNVERTHGQLSADGSYSNHTSRKNKGTSRGWGEGTRWEGCRGLTLQTAATWDSTCPSPDRQHTCLSRNHPQQFLETTRLQPHLCTLPSCHGSQQGLIHFPMRLPQLPQPLRRTPTGPGVQRPPGARPPSLPWLCMTSDLLFPTVKSLNEVISTGEGARGGSPRQ